MRKLKFHNALRFSKPVAAALAVCWPLMLFGELGDTRTWTAVDGRTTDARLLDIRENSVVLGSGFREYEVEMERLSREDRRYVDRMRRHLPTGTISEFVVQPDDRLAGWMRDHHMSSLQWNGLPTPEAEELRLPFLLHTPEAGHRDRERKLPLIVHLHGTGGIGQDNLRQLADGGGVARHFMEARFQSHQPTYVMLPQTARMAGWYAMSYTDPSPELSAIVQSIRLMAASPDYQLDLSRIYVTGLSMGGAGACQAMAKFPGFFAAAIPISYVPSIEFFNKDNVGPVWVAVNRGDGNLEERLRQFRRDYLALGGSIRVTVFDRGGHDAWTALLSDGAFRTWLFQRQL